MCKNREHTTNENNVFLRIPVAQYIVGRDAKLGMQNETHLYILIFWLLGI